MVQLRSIGFLLLGGASTCFAERKLFGNCDPGCYCEQRHIAWKEVCKKARCKDCPECARGGLIDKPCLPLCENRGFPVEVQWEDKCHWEKHCKGCSGCHNEMVELFEGECRFGCFDFLKVPCNNRACKDCRACKKKKKGFVFCPDDKQSATSTVTVTSSVTASTTSSTTPSATSSVTASTTPSTTSSVTASTTSSQTSSVTASTTSSQTSSSVTASTTSSQTSSPGLGAYPIWGSKKATAAKDHWVWHKENVFV